MKITFLFVILSFRVFCQMQEDTLVVQNQEVNINNLIDIHVDVEDFTWHDSTKVKFLTITHRDDKYNLAHADDFLSKKYHDLHGPTLVGHKYTDSCFIHPIFNERKKSYFLIDDFDSLTDSIVYLSIAVSTGYIDQGSVYILYEHPSIRLDEITTVLDGVNENSNQILATKEWYNKWIRKHRKYNDHRKIHLGEQCP